MVGFTLLANLLVVTTFVWTEWIPAGVRAGGWMLLVGVWLVAWMITGRGPMIAAGATSGSEQVRKGNASCADPTRPLGAIGSAGGPSGCESRMRLDIARPP